MGVCVPGGGLRGARGRYKILPEILSALDYAGLGNVALPPMFAMAEALDAADFESRVAPVIVKLFARPNRAVRMSLLKHLPAFVNHLAAGTINDNIFPSFVTGFTCVTGALGRLALGLA